MHDTTTPTTPTTPTTHPTDDKTLASLRARTLEDLRRIAPDHLGQSLSTEQLAHLFGVQPGTVRRGHCLAGHYFGLIPTKLGNGRLRWTLA